MNTTGLRRKGVFIALVSLVTLAVSEVVRRTSASAATNDVSKELARMYQEDQDDRTDILSKPHERWANMANRDKQRHERVLSLLREDKLCTADDYYYAAMIMQHGDDARDYTLAHILSMAAAQRGSKPAIWLSAASFDRLMQSAGQPQVFATQFYSEANGPYKLREPIDKDLITDAMRKAFNVPTLAESYEREKKLNADLRSEPKPSNP
ncbi:MAG: hypothetical protein K2Z81_12135 [Cyanobacteria bacterium]|nr:hypothetical protein [Cyanobacteriota bacterium]